MDMREGPQPGERCTSGWSRLCISKPMESYGNGSVPTNSDCLSNSESWKTLALIGAHSRPEPGRGLPAGYVGDGYKSMRTAGSPARLAVLWRGHVYWRLVAVFGLIRGRVPAIRLYSDELPPVSLRIEGSALRG